MQAMVDATLRHRLLASPVRSRLLALLRGSRRPMGIQELSAALGLHPNSVRDHLDRLVEAGFARTETAPPNGRGRPALRYAARGRAEAEGDGPGYRALASALVEQLASGDDPVADSEAAGERWGDRMARPLAPVDGQTEAVERLLALLDEAGFEPERPVALGQPVRLRSCPFRALARERRAVVCGVHLGMMRGVLRRLDAPTEGVSLEPFVAPDLCIAHLGGRPDA